MTQAGRATEKSTKQVLIVDDDESVLNLLSHVVGKEGFRAATAVDGEDALRRIEADPPELVVLDLMMPRYGGFEVLRRLQDSPSTSKIPVIIITGRYTDRSTAELIRQESNVVDFLEKPVKLALLTGALHRALGTAPPDAAQPGGQA